MTSTRVGVSNFSTSLIGCSAQELLQRDVRIVRWFIGERWGRCAKTDSTLGQWNFFSPRPLNPKPTFMARVTPLLLKALGVRL